MNLSPSELLLFVRSLRQREGTKPKPEGMKLKPEGTKPLADGSSQNPA
ncbi:MAG: hypothetical protein LBD54_01680 [Puniceicoccales bacterium]|jgi:hypothetical protein|nr:hypothetical protein [Puniceicoccales bacterium]